MDSFTPVTGSPLHVHDRNNPKVHRLFKKNNSAGKIAAEMSPGGRVKPAESFRVGTDFIHQALHLTKKTPAEPRRNFGVITNRRDKFFLRFRMKQIFHRPAILRA